MNPLAYLSTFLLVIGHSNSCLLFVFCVLKEFINLLHYYNNKQIQNPPSLKTPSEFLTLLETLEYFFVLFYFFIFILFYFCFNNNIHLPGENIHMNRTTFFQGLVSKKISTEFLDTPDHIGREIPTP